MSAAVAVPATSAAALTATCDGPGDAAVLEPHREDWQRLFGRAANEPSCSFAWTAALCRSHVTTGEPIAVIRVQRGNDPLLLTAVTTRRLPLFGRHVVTAMPVGEHYTTHSSLAAAERTPAVADAFVDTLLAMRPRWDLFRMATLLDDANGWLPLLVDSLARRGIGYSVRHNYPSYVLPLPESFEAYLATRSSKFRNHLKRTLRKVEALGGVDVIDYSDSNVDRTSSGQAFGDLFAAVLEVERHSWKHAHGSALSAVPRQAFFFEELAKRATVPPRLHLQVLRIDGRPVAHNIGTWLGDTYFYLKTSVDDEFKSVGAATYLRAKLFEWVFAQRLRVIDFPAEPYEWERQWADDVRWHKTLVVYGRTMTGQTLRLVDAVRHRKATAPTLTHWDPREQRPVTDE